MCIDYIIYKRHWNSLFVLRFIYLMAIIYMYNVHIRVYIYYISNSFILMSFCTIQFILGLGWCDYIMSKYESLENLLKNVPEKNNPTILYHLPKFSDRSGLFSMHPISHLILYNIEFGPWNKKLWKQRE